MITITYNPELWQLVPRKLTDEMFEFVSTSQWQQLLGEAPTPPELEITNPYLEQPPDQPI